MDNADNVIVSYLDEPRSINKTICSRTVVSACPVSFAALFRVFGSQTNNERQRQKRTKRPSKPSHILGDSTFCIQPHMFYS